jgi:hypothetical protein
MTMATNTDWELLNAYSDGELSPDDANALEKRILTDPDLADALKQIENVSHALQTLRPDAPLDAIPPKVATWRSRNSFIAMAASVALVIFFAGQLFLTSDRPLSPTDLHQAFLQQSFTDSAPSTVLANTSSDLPDLTGANLTLVAETNDDASRALHYAGRNGCRLTLTINTGNAPVVKAEANLLLASWSISAVHYTLLSTGMDANRFAAISKFVRVFFEQKDRPDTVVAMRDATRNAVPCGAA